MDLAVRWHRLLRALAFIAGLVLGLGLAVFIFSNTAPVDIHWRLPSNNGPVVDLTIPGISLWLLAIVPLLVGGVVGYFYQTPARMHHVREALRHRSRVHELEHELKELRLSLDKVLMMPEDGSLAVPAALMPPIEHRAKAKVAQVSLPEEPSAADLLADIPDPEEATPVPAPVEDHKEVAAPAQAHRPARRKAAAANGAPRPGAKRARTPRTAGKS
ncbi:MAG TPA: LapA family protein [Candidatus Dormibacteraeota bacterium]|nr:LapA family protein [Candidatus Dormibacteraeota bacterium]